MFDHGLIQQAFKLISEKIEVMRKAVAANRPAEDQGSLGDVGI